MTWKQVQDVQECEEIIALNEMSTGHMVTEEGEKLIVLDVSDGQRRTTIAMRPGSIMPLFEGLTRAFAFAEANGWPETPSDMPN